ncbi:NADP/NAD-dependent aldehyde dehydrogenase PuuC [Acinetobacter calcoaceticus]
MIVNGLWINNEEVNSQNGSQFERFCPATGELISKSQLGTANDVNDAVSAAKNAFDNSNLWKELPAEEKYKALSKWADLIDLNKEEISQIESKESGKPIEGARGEVEWSITLLKYATSLVWQLSGDTFNNVGSKKIGYTLREARGVVAMITPWNYPMVTLFQKLPYALAAGCTCVIKPSELTPSTTYFVAKLAKEAGIPAGVINVINGTGEIVGSTLTKHPDVDMISFTGSTNVGKIISINAAETNKHVSLELGGKSANIVFDDADFSEAIDGVLLGFTLNQGEECVAASRLIISENIVDKFVDELAKRASKLVVDLPLNDTTQIGALINATHYQKVLSLIEEGEQEGANLLLDGRKNIANHLRNGFFIKPTIFTNVHKDMTIFQEEIFGPVLCVSTFKTYDEAIELANDTKYGLGNGIWTRDLNKAIHASKSLRSGTVFVNTYFETLPQLPFGGYKASGIGRENGLNGLLEFTEIKSVFINVDSRDFAYPNTI